MVPLRLVSVNNLTGLSSTVPQFCSCSRVIGISLLLAQPASNISTTARAQLVTKNRIFERVDIFIGAAVLPGNRASVQWRIYGLVAAGRLTPSDRRNLLQADARTNP